MQAIEQDTTCVHFYAAINGVPRGKRKTIRATKSLGYDVTQDEAIAHARCVLDNEWRTGATAEVVEVVGTTTVYDNGVRIFRARLFGASRVVARL